MEIFGDAMRPLPLGIKGAMVGLPAARHGSPLPEIDSGGVPTPAMPAWRGEQFQAMA